MRVVGNQKCGALSASVAFTVPALHAYSDAPFGRPFLSVLISFLCFGNNFGGR